MLGFSYEMLISNKDVSTNEASDFCNRRIRRLSDIDESKEASSESDLLLMKYDLDKSNRDSGQSSGYFEWSSSSSIQQSEYYFPPPSPYKVSCIIGGSGLIH